MKIPQILKQSIGNCLDLSQHLLSVVLPLQLHLLLHILFIDIICHVLLYLFDLKQRVLRREPTVIVSADTLFNKLLKSVVCLRWFLFEVKDKVDVMENIMGLFQMFIEPFKLELKLISFHSANKASWCLVLFYRTLFLSNLREFVNNSPGEYLFYNKGSEDDVSQVKNHFNVDCISVLIVFWDIAI